MHATARSYVSSLSPFEQLRYAQEVLKLEAQAIRQVVARLGDEFCQAAELLYACRGAAVVSGIGKAGLVGQKLSATLTSTGTCSHFLHPSEAMHGDLGRIRSGDVVLLLSNSGETEEVLGLLPALARIDVPTIVITSRPASTLARAAQVVLDMGPMQEACTLGLAPSTSTTAMLALGDALALVVSRMRGFTPIQFAQFHPGGSLGRKLSTVDECMRPLDQCRVAHQSQTVREVLVAAGRPGRRSGAIMLVDDEGLLRGIFTDSDLARLFESRQDDALDRPAQEVMTSEPCTVPQGAQLCDAVVVIQERKLSELPVIDGAGRPVGMLDITDVVGLPSDDDK